MLPLLGLFVIFTSCYPSQVSTTSGAMLEPDLLYANSWDLAELNGTPITSHSYITFTPGSNRLTGYTSCNYLGGTIAMSANNGISLTPFATTKNNCAGNTLDASLISSMRGVDRWGMVGDQLVMYDDGRIIARWSPSNFTNNDLEGNWQLTYVSDNTMPFDVMFPVERRPTIVFNSGSDEISGNTGFNTFSCPMTINSNGIAFADCTSSKLDCEGPGEAIFLKDLKNINNYTITDDNTLVFFTDDNTVMKFTRIK